MRFIRRCDALGMQKEIATIQPRPTYIEEYAAELQANGFQFIANKTDDGRVCLYIENLFSGEIVAQITCPNGPEVLNSVDSLVKAGYDFYRRGYNKTYG